MNLSDVTDRPRNLRAEYEAVQLVAALYPSGITVAGVRFARTNWWFADNEPVYAAMVNGVFRRCRLSRLHYLASLAEAS